MAQALQAAPGFFWLDSAAHDSGSGRYSFLGAWPKHILTACRDGARLDGRRLPGSAFDIIRSILSQNQVDTLGERAPFAGGWVGYLTYEFAETLMPWTSPHSIAPDAPLAEFGFYDAVLVFDHQASSCGLSVIGDPRCFAAAALLDAHAQTRENPGGSESPLAAIRLLAWRPSVGRHAYVRAVRQVQDHIAAGDVYQANLAQRFSALMPANLTPFAHYLQLRQSNPAPFSAFLKFPGRTIASTSPECFLTVCGASVKTHPIKGTIRRSDDPIEDARLAAQLQASEKDRAENIMIVDLLRNDLSRACRPHTVRTPAICELRSYAGLHHLVSTIEGELAPPFDALDLVACAFPGGSITGAPKLRAMQIIAEMELAARGVFCGAIGYFGVDRTADLNIAIRTVTYESGEAVLHAGGGITALSDPDEEYQETMLKAERIVRGAPR